jgi:hypothetical protein
VASIFLFLEELLSRNLLFGDIGQFKEEVDHFVLEQWRPYGGQSTRIVAVIVPHLLFLTRHHPGLSDNCLGQLFIRNLYIIFLADLRENEAKPHPAF